VIWRENALTPQTLRSYPNAQIRQGADRDQTSVSQITHSPRVRHYAFICSWLISIRGGRHGKRLSARRTGEETRPANPPKRSLWRGRHLLFYVLGGRNNQN